MAAVGAATPLQFLVMGVVGMPLPFLCYLGAVLLGAWRGGLGPGLVATVASSLAATYFFVPPGFSLTIGWAGLFAVACFALQGILVAALCERRLRAEFALAETVERLTEERDARAKLLKDERASREDAERARREAQDANRAKDLFLAMLSHELRTPLNPIIGWTQMLQRGGLSPKAQANALEVIERNAKLQNQLIEDLLDVSRIAQGKFELRPQRLLPERVVHTAVETVRPLAYSTGVELEIQAAENLPAINADPTRLTQAVWNLLTNAIKFTPGAGRVGVRMETRADAVRIEVGDSGVGIAPEFLPRLFDRFSQGSEGPTRTRGGLGLGLFIVRHIVEAHGGRVWAESEGEGKGSAFIIELPIAGAE